MKLQVRRWVFLLAGGTFLALAMLATVIGTKPYGTPVIAQAPGGQTVSFDGISRLIADARERGTTLHVLWIHGMCTHGLSWAAERATLIAAALDGTATRTGTVEETAGLMRVLYQIHTPAGDFDATFVVWSAMTQRFKRRLDFDSPDGDRATAYPYRRATLNKELKNKLINDCLSDVVIYGGQHGDPIRAAMKPVVCRALGGTPAAGQLCDFAGADLDRPLAVVAESLGGKILFDAARVIYEEMRPVPRASSAIAHRLASVQTIYLLANPIPLLDIASPLMSPLDGDMRDEDAPYASCLSQMIEMMHAARSTLPPDDRSRGDAAPTVVVFTDPNDVVSYRLVPSVQNLARARLIDVIGSNATTWFGYIERPDNAHCGYKWNHTVIGLIALGYKVGEPAPRAPIVGSHECP